MGASIYHHFRLPEELSKRLRAMTARPGASMTQVVVDAVTAYVDHAGTTPTDERFAIRLDRLSRSNNRMEMKMAFIAEALGTFIQHQLTLVAHLPPFEPETAKLGRRRYEAFLDLVSSRIAGSGFAVGSDKVSETDMEPDPKD